MMADKVLIVDDDKSVIDILYKVIRSNGIEADLAHSGEEALVMAGSSSYDLLLLDINMHGIDGFEVIRRLRADDATKDLPIIILSALNSEQDISKGFQLGANDFINKPIIMEKLLSSVTTQINLQAAKQAAG